MATDILASLQTLIDTSTPQNIMQTQPAESQAKPGLFAALVAECMETVQDTETLPELLMPLETEAQPETEEQTFTFNGNNTFGQSVLEILANTQEQPEELVPETEEPLPEATEGDAVIWPEDKPEEPEAGNFAELKQAVSDIKDFAREKLSEIELPVEEIVEEVITDDVLAKIPDAMREEISQVINDVAGALKQEDGTEPQPVMQMLSALNERIAVPKAESKPAENPDNSDEQEESDVQDETSEIPENITELAGLAGVTNIQAQPVQSEAPETQEQPDVLEAPARQVRPSRQVRTEQPEAEKAPEESQNAPESQETRTNFREVLANRNTEHETSEQDTSGEGQGQRQNQDNHSDSRNTSQRLRTDTRRVDSRTQNERTAPQSSTHRTESRSDFASYFEGVLTSRRTASRTSPLPLDLRGTENFTQATAIRDGITNVVRFIRADGLQKARVVVDPPALGRISVELTSGTSGVEASIKVSSEQIRQLVQDQLSQLRMNLSQQGVQVAEFTVDVQQDNSGQQQNPQQQQQGMLNFGSGIDDDDETEDFRVDLEEGLLYWVA
ncbi:MAG: flagellar hook-length control protein FliK [Synergistaceae bacterium]|nr:flagellar hook-length control protein FliK [Synergistaceae bacterium]